MEKQMADLILVPSGLLVMLAYHVWLFYRIMKHPTTTVIGVNAINRRFWVQAMMEDVSKNGVLAVQTMRNTIMASTLLAMTAVMLSSLTAVLMTEGNTSGDPNVPSSFTVFGGDTSQGSFAVKYFCILSCFLVAFLLNVQSIRYYSHASILINVPFKKMTQNRRNRELTVDYVAGFVNRGSYFWSLGLRAFYFSIPLFLWLFGAIPMFVSCFVLVLFLYFFDVTFECKWINVGITSDEEDQGPRDEELGRI